MTVSLLRQERWERNSGKGRVRGNRETPLATLMAIAAIGLHGTVITNDAAPTKPALCLTVTQNAPTYGRNKEQSLHIHLR